MARLELALDDPEVVRELDLVDTQPPRRARPRRTRSSKSTGPVIAVLAPVVGPRFEWERRPEGLFKVKRP